MLSVVDKSIEDIEGPVLVIIHITGYQHDISCSYDGREQYKLPPISKRDGKWNGSLIC